MRRMLLGGMTLSLVFSGILGNWTRLRGPGRRTPAETARPTQRPRMKLTRRPRRTPAETPPKKVLAKDPPGMKRLDPQCNAWIDPKYKRVVVDGEVCLVEGPLEMFACLKGTKEHESIIAVDCKAFVLHAALLAVAHGQRTCPVQSRVQIGQRYANRHLTRLDRRQGCASCEGTGLGAELQDRQDPGRHLGLLRQRFLRRRGHQGKALHGRRGRPDLR